MRCSLEPEDDSLGRPDFDALGIKALLGAHHVHRVGGPVRAVADHRIGHHDPSLALGQRVAYGVEAGAYERQGEDVELAEATAVELGFLGTPSARDDHRACAPRVRRREGRKATGLQPAMPRGGFRPWRGARDIDGHRGRPRHLGIGGLRRNRQRHTVGHLTLPAELNVVLTLVIEAMHDDRRTQRRRAVKCGLAQEQ